MPLTVIAEIGINWEGSIRQAFLMIEKAKACGADFAKFQFYSANLLFGPSGGSTPNPQLHREMSWMDGVTKEDMVSLKSRCDAFGIKFLASVFDEERLGWYASLNPSHYKIASRTVKYDPDFCLDILKKGKPTFVSLGMWEPSNYQSVESFMFPFPGFTNAQYLYCLAKYPAPLEDLRFPGDFRVAKYEGFSDHTVGIEAALIAIARGAKVIEVHVTLDRNSPGPDHAASKTFQELGELVRVGRKVEAAVETMR